jgi:hypothetical protein
MTGTCGVCGYPGAEAPGWKKTTSPTFWVYVGGLVVVGAILVGAMLIFNPLGRGDGNSAGGDACALATTSEGMTWIRVKGVSAGGDCRKLLAGLESYKAWEADFPPSDATEMVCQLATPEGNALEAWSNSTASLCPDLQAILAR